MKIEHTPTKPGCPGSVKYLTITLIVYIGWLYALEKARRDHPIILSQQRAYERDAVAPGSDVELRKPSMMTGDATFVYWRDVNYNWLGYAIWLSDPVKIVIYKDGNRLEGRIEVDFSQPTSVAKFFDTVYISGFKFYRPKPAYRWNAAVYTIDEREGRTGRDSVIMKVNRKVPEPVAPYVSAAVNLIS